MPYLWMDALGAPHAANTWGEVQRSRHVLVSGNRNRDELAHVAHRMVARVPDGTPVAFTDGSYDRRSRTGGWAFALFADHDHDTPLRTASGVIEHPSSWQVACECTAAIEAVRAASALGLGELVIACDYVGVTAWALGLWDATSGYARDLVEACSSDVAVSFAHVGAHGRDVHHDPWLVAGNDLADRLAGQVARRLP